MTPQPGVVAAFVAAALVGTGTAVAAIAVHRSGAAWLALAVTASFGVAWALRSTDTPRLGAAFCLGWLVALGFAIAGRPEGDYVLAGDAAGYALMATGFGLVVLGVTSLGRGPAGSGP